MRRTFSLLAVVLLAGCGGAAPQPVEPARAAAPQRAPLDWRESYPAKDPQLVFEVESLEVLADGWSVEVAVTNAGTTTFETGRDPSQLSYGLMLFKRPGLDRLEEANRTGRLPAIRRAVAIEPAPPPVLEPGGTWRATLSAPGSLAAGSYVRVVFGPLLVRGKPPGQLPQVVLWITDHSYRLRGSD